MGDRLLATCRAPRSPVTPAGGSSPSTNGVQCRLAQRGAPVKRCEEHRAGVEQVLSQHFGRPVPLVLVVDDGIAAPTAVAAGPPQGDDTAGIDEADEIVDVHELEDAPADNRSDVDRIASRLSRGAARRGGSG